MSDNVFDDGVVEKAEELKNEYEKLHKQWKEAAKQAVTGDEYQQTKPLFEKEMRAHKEWRDYSFKHGHKIYAKAKKQD